MPLPEQIAVKYTEEEAEYLSLRPVVRQTFRLHELVDMVLGVTGKDLTRIQQILRAGTVTFNYYRYWWQGFEAGAEELSAVLARFPDSDPARVFRAEGCAAVVIAGPSYQPVPGHAALPTSGIELTQEEAARKRLFSGRSFWDALMALAREKSPAYLGYSYLRRVDLYCLEVAPEHAAALARDAQKLAPRSVRMRLGQLRSTARILFLCPRPASS